MNINLPSTHLLITRPEKQAKISAEYAKKCGFIPLLNPLLRVEHSIKMPLPRGFNACVIDDEKGVKKACGIIFTSANGPLALPENFMARFFDVPVITTGKASQEAAIAKGFTDVFYHQGSALALVENIESWMQQKGLLKTDVLLYPCAHNMAHDVPALLKDKNIICHDWPVYKTIFVKQFEPQIISSFIEGKIDGVLLYSAKTAQCFMRLFSDLQKKHPFIKKPQIFTLSDAICAKLSDDMAQNCHFPLLADEKALFECICNVFSR